MDHAAVAGGGICALNRTGCRAEMIAHVGDTGADGLTPVQSVHKPTELEGGTAVGLRVRDHACRSDARAGRNTGRADGIIYPLCNATGHDSPVNVMFSKWIAGGVSHRVSGKILPRNLVDVRMRLLHAVIEN